MGAPTLTEEEKVRRFVTAYQGQVAAYAAGDPHWVSLENFRKSTRLALVDVAVKLGLDFDVVYDALLEADDSVKEIPCCSW